MSHWQRLIVESQALDESAAAIVKIGGTNARTQVVTLQDRYAAWYADCLSVLPSDLYDRFRLHYDDGIRNKDTILSFFQCKIWPPSSSVAVGKIGSTPVSQGTSYSWLFAYDMGFKPYLHEQRIILMEAQAREKRQEQGTIGMADQIWEKTIQRIVEAAPTPSCDEQAAQRWLMRVETFIESMGRQGQRFARELVQVREDYRNTPVVASVSAAGIDTSGIPTTETLINGGLAILHAISDAITDRTITEPVSAMTIDTQGDHPSSDPHQVFVVHGRDKRLRDALFSFLRALGLRPLEWSEVVKATGKATPYIGDVLDQGFAMARAVVVLLTPDDEARLRDDLRGPDEPDYETSLTYQPRPNVLFEAGMALGRHPDRTLLIQIGHVRPVSDLSGRHVIRLDNTPQLRHEVAERLRTAGCAVNTQGTDWFGEGDFALNITGGIGPSKQGN